MNARRTLLSFLAAALIWSVGGPGLTAEPPVMSLSDSFVLGSGDAPVTLIEFSDFECFYCRRHTIQIQPRLVENYVKTGKLRYAVRAFPHKDTESPGFLAAEAALCAGDQNQYWEMRTLLFDRQEDLSGDEFTALARSLGLKTAPFETCLAGRSHRETVLADYRQGKAAGIKAVPAFFLGLTDPDNPGRIRVVKTITGSKTYKIYASAIDRLLLRAQAKNAASSTSKPE